MHQRPALRAGKDGRVDLLRDLLVVAQDHAATRAAQRLVRGAGGDVRVRHRARIDARGHQAGHMRHVHHQQRAHLVGDGAEARPVDDARVGREAGDEELGAVLARQAGDLVVVDQAVALAHAVLHCVEPLARERRPGAVRQMAAGRQRHAQHRVARLEQGQHHRGVGLRAGVRLHIGEACAEELAQPLDRQRLDHVGLLAAAVVALARIALGVLVGEHRALGLKHRAGDDVLGGDQLDLALLAVELAADRAGDLRIGLGQRGGEEVGSVHGVGEGCGEAGRGDLGWPHSSSPTPLRLVRRGHAFAQNRHRDLSRADVACRQIRVRHMQGRRGG